MPIKRVPSIISIVLQFRADKCSYCRISIVLDISILCSLSLSLSLSLILFLSISHFDFLFHVSLQHHMSGTSATSLLKKERLP